MPTGAIVDRDGQVLRQFEWMAERRVQIGQQHLRYVFAHHIRCLQLLSRKSLSDRNAAHPGGFGSQHTIDGILDDATFRRIHGEFLGHR